jgi:NAD(P)H-hydrate epimerase
VGKTQGGETGVGAERATRLPRIAPDALPWLSVAQMREVDRVMLEDLVISLARMMENAGSNVALVARLLLGGDALRKRVVVLAVPGGNGGGGLVAARHLAVAGADVEVRMSSPEKELAPVTAEQLAILQRMGVRVSVGARGDLGEPAFVLDCLLGYGQRGLLAARSVG